MLYREFKIAVMKKLNELQENSERQFTFNGVRNKTNEQKKYFAKDIETLKRNQKEIRFCILHNLNEWFFQ